jgi:hypothetical protein
MTMIGTRPEPAGRYSHAAHASAPDGNVSSRRIACLAVCISPVLSIAGAALNVGTGLMIPAPGAMRHGRLPKVDADGACFALFA